MTHKDSYLLPRIDNTLEALSGSEWFSTLDLKPGYWQVELAEEDQEKSAFSMGCFKWLMDQVLVVLGSPNRQNQP